MNGGNPLPLVSVLIPCHNGARWLRETLASVCRQSWRALEVIVVDDGSSDGSAGVAREFADRGVQVVEQANRGAAAARNRAFALSRGELVQFLDADDLLAPDKIELQVRCLAGRTDWVAAGGWARFREFPEEARFEPEAPAGDQAPVDFLVDCWTAGGSMMFPARWLVPRRVAEQSGPWNEALTLNDDGEYFTRVVLASRGVARCPFSRAYYRSGVPHSLSSRKSAAAWRSQFAALEYSERAVRAAEDSPRVRRACAMLWQVMAFASYPYAPALANDALRRGEALHPVRIRPEGGPVFQGLARLLGWRGARVLQRLSGRW